MRIAVPIHKEFIGKYKLIFDVEHGNDIGQGIKPLVLLALTLPRGHASVI